MAELSGCTLSTAGNDVFKCFYNIADNDATGRESKSQETKELK